VAITTPNDDVALDLNAVGESDVPAPATSAADTSRVEAIVRSLSARLGDGFDDAALAAEVEAEFAAYAGSRVTQFLAIFVERAVWARLSQPRSIDHWVEEERRDHSRTSGS